MADYRERIKSAKEKGTQVGVLQSKHQASSPRDLRAGTHFSRSDEPQHGLVQNADYQESSPEAQSSAGLGWIPHQGLEGRRD